jgi:hypothetical protein
VAGLAHLAGAAGAELDLASLAQSLGGFRKAQDGPDLVAQEQDGDAEQHEGGGPHPDQEDVRVGRISLVAPGQDAHDLVLVELDPHFHVVGAPHRVDPVGPLDLAAQLVRQGFVEDREEGLGARRRQVRVLEDVHVELEPLRGDPRQGLLVPVLRVALVDVHQGGDVRRHGRGQAAGDELVMALHERIGDDRLQQDDRRDDDDERAGIKPLRQGPAEPAGDPGDRRVSQRQSDLHRSMTRR